MALMNGQLPLKKLGQGKIRDIYEIDNEYILLIATDRLSAFDVIMPDTAPRKGEILTQLSAWWFRKLADIVNHHMISAETEYIIDWLPVLAAHRDAIHNRAMICKRAHVVPIECVVRGYIFGSGWHEYSETGTLAAERLPEGLIIAEKLASPKFTPATKALIGHDENISLTQMEVSIGTHLTSKLIILSHQIFERGSSIAAERGLILADTKFEFGTDADGKIFLIDEVLTPDCSRFWLSDCWIPGSPGPSLDKQPLRDYLKIEMNMGRWNGKTPAPKLPLHMITAICRRYEEFYQRITGAFL